MARHPRSATGRSFSWRSPNGTKLPHRRVRSPSAGRAGALAGVALVDPASVGRLNQAVRLLRFVLERQLDLGPVDQSPTVTDDDVLLVTSATRISRTDPLTVVMASATASS